MQTMSKKNNDALNTKAEKRDKKVKADKPVSHEEIKSDEQLDFGLKEPTSNKYYNIKNRLYFSQQVWKNQRFAKDTFVWMFVIFTILCIALQVYILSIHFNQLPANIPILQMYLAPVLRLLPKSFVVIFPVITTTGFFISFPIGSRVYYENKYLGLFALAVSFVSSTFLTYATIKLISFYI